MKQFPIYFSDLDPETQRNLCATLGLEENDFNEDMPIATVFTEGEEDEWNHCKDCKRDWS